MSSEREILIENLEEAPVVMEKHEKVFPVSLPVSNVSSKARTFLEYIYSMEDDDARQDLYELMEQFATQEEQSGDADDYHNFAVDLARRDEYALACRVLEAGLTRFPKNVDLLADFLQYGVSCNRLEECKKYYKALIKIPTRRWTWRGFAFLVDYLQFLCDRSDSDKEIAAKETEMLTVVNEFRKRFPYSEESYRTEANVYRILNMPDKEAEVLRLALENVRVTPKCSLRYADVMFDRGMYEDALPAIQRCIRDATQTQTSVNEGYIYYLSALIKMAIAQHSSLELEISKDKVNDIYSDFNIALAKFRETKNSYTEVIRTKTNTIVNKTGIEVSPAYEYLCECIAE